MTIDLIAMETQVTVKLVQGASLRGRVQGNKVGIVQKDQTIGEQNAGIAELPAVKRAEEIRMRHTILNMTTDIRQF